MKIEDITKVCTGDCKTLWAMVVVATLALLAVSAQAQTLTVLHTFTGAGDGSIPEGGLVMDRAGNLYGAASQGGSAGLGEVFRLSYKNSGWIFAPLYSFQGGEDGAHPIGRLTIGPDGSIYGATLNGGNNPCDFDGPTCGTIFNLKPPAAGCKAVMCSWTGTVLHRFANDGNGKYPVGNLVFDQQGNLYGGAYGAIFELTPSNGSWTFNVIAPFSADGGLVFDSTGNLYGTNNTAIYELTRSGSAWNGNVLHAFSCQEGSSPTGLVIDQAGNLFGATADSPTGGTVFELSPANGGWTYATLYVFYGGGGPDFGNLLLDSAGSLYGATFFDGTYGYGNIFKMAPSGNGWAYSSLYDFQEGDDNGSFPNNDLAVDANGTLYGTGQGGGTSGKGTIFQITQ